MNLVRIFCSRCAALFRRRGLDADLDEELRSHIDLAVEENLERGKSEQEARTAALRDFGGVTQTKERYRAQRDVLWLDALGQDIRFGVRMLGRNPGFTAVAVLTLALGIGGNAAVFSVVNAVLLNPLPFSQPDRLVALGENKPNFENGSISYPHFLDWRKNNRSFSSMALARRWNFSLTGRGDAEQVNGNFVSSGYFALLGVHLLLGRDFTEAEEKPGAAPVALISEGLWQRKFNSVPDILGQPITLDGRSFAIVGVIPASLHLAIPGFHDQDVYAPIGQWLNSSLMSRGAGLGFHGIARLKPGVTMEQARANMGAVTQNLAESFPDTDRGIGANVTPLKEQIVGDSRRFLFVLLAAVGFVLLIACANVASLLLARSAGRSREFAVRTALGASRSRVIRQLLTESLLLGIAAGTSGLILAAWGTHAAFNLLPAAVPRVEEIGLDIRVLAFTTIISLLTGAVFGLAPALKTSQADPHVALKDGGRGTSGTHHRALGAFVVMEMSIALVLLTGAGLMVRSLIQLWNVDPGFNPRNVLTFGLSMPPSMPTAKPQTIRAAFRDVDIQFASVPGIKAVSTSWGALPMSGDDENLFWIEGQPKPKTDNDMNWAIDYIVEPDYLKVMQIPLKRGRFFTPQDDEYTPRVAVVDDVFARKYFPDQDAIGRRINLTNAGIKLEIVGIVAHVKQWGLDLDDANALRAQIYLSCMQMPDDFVAMAPASSSMVVRYEGSLTAVNDAIRRVNKEMSAEQVIYGNQTMESVISDSMASRRFAMILLGAFAALALVLACIGIYGVMAYLVSQRTQEMGLRMALGAQRSNVLLLVLRRGAGLTLIGIGIGIRSALGLTHLMTSLLFGVSPTDPAILLCVSVLLVLVAMAACIVPAFRAASIDPMKALRTE
jgi:predicted permease